jgi:hypothetical protein
MMSKLKNISLVFFLLMEMFFFHACSRKTFNSTACWDYREKATVINYKIDGCNWILELEDGKKLQPDSLRSEFQKDNLKVLIEYNFKEGGTGICMVGEQVTITKIELRK